MDQRVSVVTLGVEDVARSRAFYTALGWEPALEPDGRVIFADPDGHLWEVAHNQFWTVAEDGAVSLQPPGTP